MKITGAKAQIFFDSWDPSRVIDGDGTITTTAGVWYRIIKKAAASSLPYDEGYIFRAPIGSGTQIVLKTGDEVYPFQMDRICKTSADLTAEQGTVDASDDCDPGASILDGIVVRSGSIGSLFRYNDVTGDFDDVTDTIVEKFFDILEDDGAGVYTLKARNDDAVYMLVNLNSAAKAGQTEIWLTIPIIISSMSMSLGNTDIQNKDMSWTQGEGKSAVYKAPKAA
ncbi:MAG: hypothetical protein LBJ31_11930 [Treponema sp.]|jgi:hypothetical protein|nr:hypothetical protein [Treponema sp.]